MRREAFALAIGYFTAVLARVPADAWERPALGVWSVRDLAGHTSRAMTNVERYATVGAEGATIGSSGDIAERGREAGRALGADPAAAIRDMASRVVTLVDSLPDDHSMATPFGRLRLIDYLPTRVAELTIHGMDLADAIGVEVSPPDECLRVALHALGDYAVRNGVGKEVAFALTGRRTLSDGFSVVP